MRSKANYCRVRPVNHSWAAIISEDAGIWISEYLQFAVWGHLAKHFDTACLLGRKSRFGSVKLVEMEIQRLRSALKVGAE